MAPVSYRPGPPYGGKPGIVTAISVLTLVGGILSTLSALLWAIGSICLWLPWVLELTAGIWGIVHGAKMIGDDRVPPNRLLAILFILTILDCNVITMTLGILILAFMSSSEVRYYFESRGIIY